MADRAPTNPAGRGIQVPAPLRLEVTSDPAALAGVRRTVEAFARSAGFGSRATGDIGLCVNEALANVIRHAYRGRVDGPIVVTADCREGTGCSDGGDGAGEHTGGGGADCGGPRLRVTIRDWGSGMNPSALLGREPDPQTPGGLGLVCLRQLMDSVEFAPQPDGMLLTMTKKKC
jgi:anti-sigma regulatory factor (Ser/Thr protein kinase)